MSVPPFGQTPPESSGGYPGGYGWGGGPYPGGSPPISQYAGPPGGPPRRNPLRGWLIAGGATLGVVVALAVTVAIVLTSGSDTTAAKPSQKASAPSAAPVAPTASAPTSSTSRPLDRTDLNSLLLTPETISSRLNTPMTVDPANSGDAPLNLTVTPPNCASAYAPATATAYDGSGFTDIAVQTLRGPEGSFAQSAIQAVAAFPDAAAARAFQDQQLAAWLDCKYTRVTADYGDGTTGQAKIGVPGETPEKNGSYISILAFSDPDLRSSAGCNHAITTQDNLVIDARVCLENPAAYGSTIMHEIQRNLS